jgi:PAS domain-containing protein
LENDVEHEPDRERFRSLIEEIRLGWARSDADIYQHILDSIPPAVLLVDRDATVIDMNAAAAAFVGAQDRGYAKKLCGDVLHCVHAREGVCGYTPHCPCDFRVAVEMACAGKPTYRKQVRLERFLNEVCESRSVWITATTFEFSRCRFAVLTIEDLAELLRSTDDRVGS